MHKKVIFAIFFILTMAAFQAQASQIRSQNIKCKSRNNIEYCKSEKGRILNGKVAVRRPNGTIGSVTEFKNGYRDGECLLFDNKGKLVERTIFSRGVMNGVDVFYHRNGKIWIAAPYLNGLLDGPVDIFTSKGKRRGRFVYDKGKLQRGYCQHIRRQIKYSDKNPNVAFNQLVTCGGR